MAEVVQKRIEGMTEEMEEMRRIKLFSVEETRYICNITIIYLLRFAFIG